MTDFTSMSLLEVSALNTEQALNYFWAHVDEGYFTDRVGFYGEVVAFLHEMAGQRTYFTLCDYGCGCGQFLEAVRKVYPAAVLNGVDYAESAITRARALRIGAQWSTWDFTRPLFKPGSFDFVTCIESLEHITDYRAALQVMMDSLVPGGKLLLTVPNNDRLKCHVNHWTPGDVTLLLSEYGYVTCGLFHEEHNIIAKVTKR